jgi:hypothetical protein
VLVIAMWIGLELTLFGMGLVFLLLALLWGLISLLVRLDNPPSAVQEKPYAPAVDSASRPPLLRADTSVHPASSAAVRRAQPSLKPELVAAIVIACRTHRMVRRKQAAPELRTHEPGSLPSRWVGSGRTRQNRSWAPGGRFA